MNETHDISQGRLSFLIENRAYENPERLAYFKKLYRTLYNRRAKQEERKRIKPFSLSIAPKEFKMLKEAAQTHDLPVGHFITQSALAYLNQAYLPPDKKAISELKQILSGMASDIRSVATNRNHPYHMQLRALAEKVDDIEEEIYRMLTKPPRR